MAGFQGGARRPDAPGGRIKDAESGWPAGRVAVLAESRAAVVLATVIVAVVLVAMVWRGPWWLDSKWLPGKSAELRPQDATLITGLRTALVQVLIALGATIALWFTWRNYRLTRRG